MSRQKGEYCVAPALEPKSYIDDVLNCQYINNITQYFSVTTTQSMCSSSKHIGCRKNCGASKIVYLVIICFAVCVNHSHQADNLPQDVIKGEDLSQNVTNGKSIYAADRCK